MSVGDGDWTAVFSGTVNCRTAPAAGAGGAGVSGAEGTGASPDGWNCHGVSGDGGARSVVTLQAPSSKQPTSATHRTLAGCMDCAPDRRNRHRRLWWTDPVENVANVIVQQGVPRHAGREVITRAGQDRWFRWAAEHLPRALAAAHPGSCLSEPRCQLPVVDTDRVAHRRRQVVPGRVGAQIEDRRDGDEEATDLLRHTRVD